MQKDRSDLIVFIDLAFVLLVGFLILSETASRGNVVLPGDVKEPSEPMSGFSVFNVYFNGEARFWIENGGQRSCDVGGRQALLVSCMQQIVQDHVGAVFVLVPAGQATVQQLVSLLDLCKFNDWTCTVSN